VTQNAIARAMGAGLALIGEPSLLRGAPCGAALVLRGVELQRGVATTELDNYVGLVDVATIDVRFDPKVDDLFEHPSEGRFKLDRLVHDDGFIRQFIVVAR
jgi:hypothetical protein